MSEKESNHISKHQREQHPELESQEDLEQLFTMKVFKSFLRSLDRQLFEATSILISQRDRLSTTLNVRREYDR